MFSIRTVISSIDGMYPTTTPYKQTKLAVIKSKLANILDNQQDLNSDPRQELYNICKTNLLDPQFTYKQISLFGLLTSRSEDIAKTVIKITKNDIIFILLEKLQLTLGNTVYNTLINLILKECNYEIAKKYLNDFHDQLLVFPKTSNMIDSWLDRQISQKIPLPIRAQQYKPTRWPLLEIDSNQKVYDIDSITNFMNTEPIGETVSFTYAIDKHCNVVFSIGADSSYHINLCNGDPVYGAGEIYLQKTMSGIAVTVINNKSGLYLPKCEFLHTLKNWFTHYGYVTHSTLLEDEEDKLIEGFVSYRAMK